MALGQSVFNRQNNNQKKSINVHSNYRMMNSNDVNHYAGSVMGFTYWQGTLKIHISPLKMVNGQDYPVADRDREVSCYLKHTKARVLMMEIDRFLSGEFKNVSITSGTTLLTISDGSERGLEQPVICIRKLTKDLSAVEEEILYICRTDYHFAIHNFNTEEFDGDKDFESYKYMDIIELRQVLEEYCKAMTMATAYSVAETNQWVNSSINSTIDSIADKLGVSTGNGGYSSGSNELNTGSNNSFKRASLDDM